MSYTELGQLKRKVLTPVLVTLLLLALFAVATPFVPLLLWRADMKGKVGESEAEVLSDLEVDRRIPSNSDPQRFAIYGDAARGPYKGDVLVYAFMNVRALLFLGQDGRVERVEFVDLESQVADNHLFRKDGNNAGQ